MQLKCSRTACLTEDAATWWNKSTRQFYCRLCAKRINEYARTQLCEERVRDSRQKAILEWANRTFGLIALAHTERFQRFFEEAVELVQASGISADMLHKIVDYVYAKPKGDIYKEAGAVGTTLLAVCELLGFSADEAERTEAERIGEIDPAYFRERHNKKAQDGIAGVAKGED